MNAEKRADLANQNICDLPSPSSAQALYHQNREMHDSEMRSISDDKQEILHLAHVDKHTGFHYDITQMISRLEDRYHWKELQADAFSYILSCEVCKGIEFLNAPRPCPTFSGSPFIFNECDRTIKTPDKIVHFNRLLAQFNENIKSGGILPSVNNIESHTLNAVNFDPGGSFTGSENGNYSTSNVFFGDFDRIKPPKVKPFVCGLCKKTFARKDHLRNHQLTHTESRQFLCTINNCQRTFRRKDRLSEHMINFHNCPKAIFCHICHNTFTSKSMLSKHMNNQHYVYKCSVCKAGFEEYDEMVHHQQTYCKSGISVNTKALQIVNEKKKIMQASILVPKIEATELKADNTRLAKVVKLDGGDLMIPHLSSTHSEEYSTLTPLWWKFVELFIRSELEENKENPAFSYNHYLEWCQRQKE